MGEIDDGRVEVDAVCRVLIPEVPFVDLVFVKAGLCAWVYVVVWC